MSPYRLFLAFGYIFLLLSLFSLIFDYEDAGLFLITLIVLFISLFAIFFSIYKIRKEIKKGIS
ncbi:hypothetical protein B6F84_05045 [Acidianus manzaensis]|uniref:Uncharacterized protein n=1 Tax=Acidianus manzaensis TaxID=282676 RepID=A0A1W6JYV7_9CREN|nr:hypothetical protein B6F84_05045 [Acidianus manzaensis]